MTLRQLSKRPLPAESTDAHRRPAFPHGAAELAEQLAPHLPAFRATAALLNDALTGIIDAERRRVAAADR